MKKFLALLMVLAMVFALAACGASNQETAAEEETTAEEPAEEAAEETADEAPAEAAEEETAEDSDERVVTVTDMSGDEVTVTGDVDSIVNLWPAGTSSFFVMGAGDLLSALAVNSNGVINAWSEYFYPEASEIPAMGGTTPSIEELLAMDPDLVIVHPMTVSDGFAQQIRDAGIPAININFGTYDEMITSYTMLGEILGGEYQERLQTWCDMVAEKQSEVESLTADVAEEDKPVVYYIAGQSDDLLTTMGSDSICAEWTGLAGGVYATTLMDDPTTTSVTAEEIFAIDPDVIIIGGSYQHIIYDELQNTDGWKDLSAVQNGRVYTNPYGAFAWDRFGLESYLQMDYALMCIQPEIAEANGINRDSMIAEIIDFYSTMNGTEMTEEAAGYMMDGLLPDGTQEVTEADAATSASSASGEASGEASGK